MNPLAYNQLPVAVLDHLVSFEAMDGYDAAQAAAGLAIDDQQVSREIVKDIVTRKNKLNDLPQLCAERNPSLTPAQAKTLAIQIAGYILLPIAPAVGDVAGAIRAWGGDVAMFASVARVEIPEYSLDGVMKRLLTETQMTLPETELPRLEFLLRAYFSESHSREETLQALARPIKVGGLNLAVDASERLLDHVDEVHDTLPMDLFTLTAPEVQIVKPAPAPVVIAKPATPASPQIKPIPTPIVDAPVSPVVLSTRKPTNALVEKPELKKTPEPIKVENLLVKPVLTEPIIAPSKPVLQPASVYTEAKAQSPKPEVMKATSEASDRKSQMLEASRQPPPTDLLEPSDKVELVVHAKKAQEIEHDVAPMLSDIAKAVAEVKAAAGFKDAEANARLERVVDARLRDVRDAYGTQAELEKPVTAGGLGISGKALADLMERIEAAVDAVQAESITKLQGDKLELTHKRVLAEQAATALQQKQEQLLARRYAEITGKAPSKPVGATSTRASVALSSEQAISDAAKKIDANKVQQAVATVQPVIPTKPSLARTHIEDIRPPQRLTGPMEELRTLALGDFRHLSKDPKAATEKILDKIELIQKDGYKERLVAIQAWRESPLNRWYIANTQEALSRGLTTEALLREKQAAGADVPTVQELQAIVQLNTQLRF